MFIGLQIHITARSGCDIRVILLLLAEELQNLIIVMAMKMELERALISNVQDALNYRWTKR